MSTKQKYKIGDSRELLKDISGVNLVVTSPPYNVGKEYEEKLSLEDYEKMLTEVYSACYNSMVENSRICVNAPSNMKHPDGFIFNPSYHNYNALLKAGFNYRETITWNQGRDSQTAWGSWCSCSAPWLRHQTEIIYVFYKGEWNLNRDGISDLTKKEFMRCVVDLWTLSTAKKSKVGHPAPFPIELPTRLIKLFSYVNDTILDPFLGSGTTLEACMKLNRNGIGFEMNPKYELLIRKSILADYKLDKFFREQSQPLNDLTHNHN